MNTQHRRSFWRGRIRFPARSLPKYVPRSTWRLEWCQFWHAGGPRHWGRVSDHHSGARRGGCLHISCRWQAQGRTNSPAGPEPAVYATDGVGDPEADPGAESEAGPGSLAPVRQPGDAAAIVRSCPSIPLPVFPDGLNRPLPNIGTTTGVGGTIGRETCPVLACRPVHQNKPATTRSPQWELPHESVQPW